MISRAFFILLLVIGGFINSYSQEITISDKKIKVDGKEYYLHTVEKGHTLYSLSKAYDVLISEIIFENPGALDGIQPGQELKIIVKDVRSAPTTTTTIEPANHGNFVLHHVKPQETLYSLAKQYEVTVDAIKEANGEVLKDGLKIGLTIKIPVKPIETSDTPGTTIEDTPTAYPPKQPINQAPARKKGSYDVVYMLPLFLDMNDTIANRVSDMEPDHIYKEALIGLEYYQGAQLALDSLKKQGLLADVHVFDTENSPNKVRNLFYKPEVKEADIIIGPFYQNLFTSAQQLGQCNNTPIISPVLKDKEIIKGKTNVAKTSVSEAAKLREMARYISSKYCNEKVLVIHKGKEGDLQKSEWFKEGYSCDSLHKYREINYKSSWDSLSGSLSRSDTNIIVVLSEDQAFVTSFFITLDRRKKDYPMKVFGVSSWLEFENIETDYYHDLKLHLPVEHYVNYEDPAVVNFVKAYRERFKNEPTNFSYLGFDQTYYLLSALQKFGAKGDYLDKLSIYDWQGFQSRYRFERKGWDLGVENEAVNIMIYKDFQLQKVN